MNLPHRAALNPNNGTTVWGQHRPDSVTFLRTPPPHTHPPIKLNQQQAAVHAGRQPLTHGQRRCVCQQEKTKRVMQQERIPFRTFQKTEGRFAIASPLISVTQFFLWQVFCFSRAPSGTETGQQLAESAKWDCWYSPACAYRGFEVRSHNNTAVIRPAQHQRTVAKSDPAGLTGDTCGKNKSVRGLTVSTRDLIWSRVVDGGYYCNVRYLWWRGLGDDVKPLTSEPAMCTAALCWYMDSLWSTFIWICEDKLGSVLFWSYFWAFHLHLAAFIAILLG